MRDINDDELFVTVIGSEEHGIRVWVDTGDRFGYLLPLFFDFDEAEQYADSLRADELDPDWADRLTDDHDER